MKSVRNVLSLAVVGASLSAAGMAQATVVGLTNGNFESDALGTGVVSQSITGWFESSTAANYNDWIINATGATYTPQFTPGTTTLFGMSNVNGYIYQQIGTYTPGETITISGDAYHRKPGATADPFRSVTFSILSGNSTGADGTPLVATLLDSTTVSATDLGFSSSNVAQHATFSFDLGEGVSGVAGQTLWIRIAAMGTGNESFLDNLAAVGHPAIAVPTPAALPAGLGLLGLAAFSARRRRAELRA